MRGTSLFLCEDAKHVRCTIKTICEVLIKTNIVFVTIQEIFSIWVNKISTWCEIHKKEYYELKYYGITVYKHSTCKQYSSGVKWSILIIYKVYWETLCRYVLFANKAYDILARYLQTMWYYSFRMQCSSSRSSKPASLSKSTTLYTDPCTAILI